MYAAVPRITPACVIAGVVIVGDRERPPDIAVLVSMALASPKSSTLTTGVRSHLHIRGLEIAMDACPCSCAASSASAI
jgi:hypothetical protein